MSSGDDGGESGTDRRHQSGDRDPPATATNAETFQHRLRTLLLEADSNGVDVRGSWPVREYERNLWDVEITELGAARTGQVSDAESPASSILELVAAHEDVDPATLPPLFDAVGPDILEIVHRADDDSDQSVTFEYHGYRITYDADGTVRIGE